MLSSLSSNLPSSPIFTLSLYLLLRWKQSEIFHHYLLAVLFRVCFFLSFCLLPSVDLSTRFSPFSFTSCLPFCWIIPCGMQKCCPFFQLKIISFVPLSPHMVLFLCPFFLLSLSLGSACLYFSILILFNQHLIVDYSFLVILVFFLN